MSLISLEGKIRLEELARDHPLEYEELRAAGTLTPPPEEGAKITKERTERNQENEVKVETR